MLVASGAPENERGVADLRQEAIDVEVVSDRGGKFFAEPPRNGRPVVIAWLPSGASSAFYEQVVAWRSRAQYRLALLGVGVDAESLDAQTALAAGFDDFMASPFSSRELAARVRALHRRLCSTGGGRERKRFGRLVLDCDSHQLWLDGKAVPLTSTEIGVMSALVAARGQALPRARILETVWGDGSFDVSERAVDHVILRLRRKLGNPGLIETVRGVGFRLATARA